MYNKYLKDIISLSTLSPHELQKLHNELSNTEKKWENLYIQKSKETLVSSSIYLREYFEKNVFAECEYDENETFHLIPVDPINLRSQFQKYWLSRVNHLFFRASKPFRRTNPDFFTKNGKKSNFGPFSSSPVNAGCSRYPFVYVSLISSIQAC